MITKLFFLIFAFVEACEYQQRIPCRLKEVEYGFVCVNDVTYCDTLRIPTPQSKNVYTIVSSSQSGDRFTYKFGEFLPQNRYISDTDTVVKIDRRIRGGLFVGFGGGFSGAVSYVLNRLPESLRRCVYNSYFSSDIGMELTMLRVTMGGTSFDLGPWTYNETPVDDIFLSNFTQLDPRDIQRNRQIKEIMNISKRRDFKILAVPYSAPPWTKGNNDYVGGVGSLLKPKYYQTWADYYVKYLQLMLLDNIPIWAITTGDEPIVAAEVDEFQFMGWQAAEQAKWIVNNLAPTIRNSEYRPKILAFDDNRGEILTYLEEMQVGAANVMQSIDAIAVHGHSDWRSSPQLLDETYRRYPGKPIWMTEKSFGIGGKYKNINNFLRELATKGFIAGVPAELKGVQFGSWQRAENFTIELIDNLNANVTAFLYWNFILNYLGGPNYAGNYVDSPIIVDESYNLIYKQPMFYAFAHFAKFISVDSQIITAEISGVDRSLVHIVAYLRPDGLVTMVLYNNSENKTITLCVDDENKGEIRLNLKPKSINTLVY